MCCTCDLLDSLQCPTLVLNKSRTLQIKYILARSKDAQSTSQFCFFLKRIKHLANWCNDKTEGEPVMLQKKRYSFYSSNIHCNTREGVINVSRTNTRRYLLLVSLYCILRKAHERNEHGREVFRILIPVKLGFDHAYSLRVQTLVAGTTNIFEMFVVCMHCSPCVSYILVKSKTHGNNISTPLKNRHWQHATNCKGIHLQNGN